MIRFFFQFLLLTSCLGASAALASPSICVATFAIEKAARPTYADLKSDFKFDPSYKVLIPEQSRVLNQCGLGTCHLHSWVSQLERAYKARTKEDLVLSTHYLSLQHWQSRALALLEPSVKPFKLSLGADVYGSRRAILKFGLIPDEAWTGSRDFQLAQNADRISEYLRNIIARARWEMERQTDEEKVEDLREIAAEQIRHVFERVVGPVPQKFTYRGKEYTPTSFRQAFFPELTRRIVNMEVSDSSHAPTTLVEFGASSTKITAKIDDVEATARKLLDRGLNVYLSYDHNASFVDKKTGVMSIAAFEIPLGGGPLPREKRNLFGISPRGHAVQIVGYDHDEQGRITKWKIKNSWGEESGARGYYHMFSDYFRTFATSISFFDAPDLELPKIEERAPEQLDFGF